MAENGKGWVEMRVVKTIDQPLNEEMLKELIGKYVHVPTNKIEVPNEFGDTMTHNVWFGGVVAGYEVGVVAYDYINMAFGEPKTHYNILLTNGTAFVLSDTELEIRELTQEEFEQLVADEKAKQAAKELIHIPKMVLR